MIFLPLQYNKKVLYLQKTITLLGEGNGTLLQYSCLENPMDGEVWWAAVHGVAKSRTRLSGFPFTFHFHALEKEMATHSSILAWRIPWIEETGGLQSMRLQRVRHDWVNSLSLFIFMHWRRKWQPTPVFLPGESQVRGSLVGCRLWGHTESDTTERLSSLGLSCHTQDLQSSLRHAGSLIGACGI